MTEIVMPATITVWSAAGIVGKRNALSLVAATMIGILGVVAKANASDPEFQDFFFTACSNPTGALAARCGETNAGLGEVSGASQSSLNPSQTLAGNSAARTASHARGREVRAWGDKASDEPRNELDDSAADLDLGPFSVLFNGRAVFETFDRPLAESNERGYDLDALSLQIGVDHRFNRRTVIGAWLDWRKSSLDFDPGPAIGNLTANAGNIDAEGFGPAAFASVQLTNRARMDAAVGYMTSNYSLTRNAVFEPVQADNPAPVVTLVDTAADTEGQDLWGTLNWSYRLEGESWNMEPFAGLTYSTSEIDGYEEQDLSGSGLAMRVGDVDADAVTGTLGFDARRVLSLDTAVLIPQLRFAYTYGIDVSAAKSSTALLLDAGNNTLGLRGNDPDRDFAQLGLGLVAVFPHGWSLFVDGQTTIGLDDVERYRLATGFRIEL